MSQAVREILQKTEISAGIKKSTVDCTSHQSMMHPTGKYAIGHRMIEQFWDAYCSTIEENSDPGLGLQEVPRGVLPVIADIDLKIENADDALDLSQPIYRPDHVEEVVAVYQTILKSIVEGISNEHLTCILLEKPPYKPDPEKDTVKCGFHLHFPGVLLRDSDQHMHLNPRVRDELRALETFSEFVDDSGTVVDDVCRKAWLMYGSKKDSTMKPYLFSKVFNHDCEEIALEEAFRRYELYDSLEEPIAIRGNVQRYLPRILSILPNNRPTSRVKRNVVCPVKEKMCSTYKRPNIHTRMTVDEALKVAKELMPLLSDDRAKDRHEWMEIGWVLYNIGQGSPEALDLWLEFSARCPDKFDEAVCVFEWDRMVEKNITLGTLNYFARIDSPDRYEKLKAERILRHAKKGVDGAHNDIAMILQAMFGNDFVCANITNAKWYQFTNHRWKEIEQGVYLREKISKDVVDLFQDTGKNLWGDLAESEKASDMKNANKQIDSVQKVMFNLKMAPFKNNVMREAADAFYDERFDDQLNKNPYLVAFDNGIYDLQKHLFRAGRPEDFISKGMTIKYINFDESDEEVQEVHRFLEKIFPDRSVREYFLDVYCDIFVGGNSKKIVLFWTGSGNNGKSVTQTVLEKMLGDLAIKFSTTLITGNKTQSGAASPELARAAPPVRHAVLEEPDGDEQIKIGLLKSLSGSDSYWARDLFEPGKKVKEVNPYFTLTFICNKLPKLRNHDEATWDRIKVIPFETTFVRPGMPCPETYEEQLKEKKFPMDQHFSAKIPELLPAFAWVLLQHRKKPKTNYEPEKVREATNHYRRQNDIYRQFIQENIIEDDTKYITLNDHNAHFRTW